MGDVIETRRGRKRGGEKANLRTRKREENQAVYEWVTPSENQNRGRHNHSTSKRVCVDEKDQGEKGKSRKGHAEWKAGLAPDVSRERSVRLDQNKMFGISGCVDRTKRGRDTNHCGEVQ